MKTLLVFSCLLLFVYASPRGGLLGAKQCTWGPSYWCSNLTAAAGCHATKHCLQTVWPHKDFPEDKDSVCQICLDMVKQARDQLESNETEEEIQEVFEGSCKLIPIKVINTECCKLVDDFIPELIDTLASQMNPQVVCSVAGLCNNARYDLLIDEHAKTEVVTKQPKLDACKGCHKVVDIMEGKFKKTTKDDFLKALLQTCGRMGSLADGCSDIVVTYFSNIYEEMLTNFNSNNVCLLSGQCYENFHVHKDDVDVEVTPNGDVGFVDVNDDDLPCQLCEQLVSHLRDLLIADTTEAEFKKVLEGLCAQTNNFKQQCESLVEEYYAVVYNFLVSELNSTEACKMINICPAGSQLQDTPIAPLLPSQSALKAIELSATQQKQKPALIRVGLEKDTTSIKIQPTFEQQTPDMMQLPIERLGAPQNIYNKETCVFCQYFLHYVQQAITDPKTEKSVKDVVSKACSRLPSSVNETCVEFVSTYGDAFVALVAQEIDPSLICPALSLCPSEKNTDIEIFMQSTPKDQPNCPLCLFAVTKLQEMVKTEKTRSNIKRALGSLCSHLSNKLAEECEDFVNTYTDELVEMLMDDFKAQEICVYLKICQDKEPAPQQKQIYGGMTSTNEIPDYTVNGQVVKPTVTEKPQCALCEFFMKQLEDDIKDQKTEDEIKKVIHGVCNKLPKSLKTECNQFVNQYADMVLQLLVASVEPHEICAVLNLCDKPNPQKLTNDGKSVTGPLCPICKVVMQQVEQWIGTNFTEADVKEALDKVCSVVPLESKECQDFMDKNSATIYNILVTLKQPGEVCSLMFLCTNPLEVKLNRCAICETLVQAIETILANPKTDHSIEHVLEKACRAVPKKHEQQCRQIIEEVGVIIFNTVSHNADVSKVCKEVGLCFSSMIARPVF